MSKESHKISWAILFIVPFGILILYYLAFYPGCYSTDSFAYKIYFNDHHPLFFLLYLKALKVILLGFDGYILMNLLLYSLILARTLIFFLNKGGNFKVLILFSVIFSIIPNIGFMLVVYWKDIIYGISIFYFSFLLIYYVEAVKGKGSISKLFFYELFLATIFIIGTRHNGIVVVLFSFCVLFFCFKNARAKFVLVFSSALILNQIIIFTALQFGGATKTWMTFDHILVKHLSTFFYEKKLDKEGIQVLAQIMPLDSFKSQFSYYSHDGYAYGPNGNQYRENVHLLNSQIRNAFWRNVKDKPLTFLKSEFMMTELLWSPVPFKNSFRNTYCLDCGGEKLSFLRSSMLKLILLSDQIKKPFYTRLIFWSGAFQIWVLLFLFSYIAYRYGFYWTLPFIPLIGNIISLFAALVSQEFRYVFPEVLMSFIMFSYLYHLSSIKQLKKC